MPLLGASVTKGHLNPGTHLNDPTGYWAAKTAVQVKVCGPFALPAHAILPDDPACQKMPEMDHTAGESSHAAQRMQKVDHAVGENSHATERMQAVGANRQGVSSHAIPRPSPSSCVAALAQ